MPTAERRLAGQQRRVLATLGDPVVPTAIDSVVARQAPQGDPWQKAIAERTGRIEPRASAVGTTGRPRQATTHQREVGVRPAGDSYALPVQPHGQQGLGSPILTAPRFGDPSVIGVPGAGSWLTTIQFESNTCIRP